MSDPQVMVTNWMAALVDALPVGYAFGAGMMSTVNPCGFAMLPVYLSLYLGAQDVQFYERSRWLRAGQALAVAGVVSAGFMLLFGALGAVVSGGGRVLLSVVPWIALAIGAALVLLGLWMATGRHISSPGLTRLANRIGDPRNTGIRGFFVFGIAFGAASLSCTLPIFLVVVGSAVAATSFVGGLVQFFSYALGMGLVILALTLGVALFREGLIVEKVRKIMPYVQHVTAAILILAGSYIVYYWLFKGGLISYLT